MNLFRFNKPDYSLLLMAVRFGDEEWPKNKVRVLACDEDGRVFTQLINKEVYRSELAEIQKGKSLKNNYATICVGNGRDKVESILIDIEVSEARILEDIAEVALHGTRIPEEFSGTIREIIALGQRKYHHHLVSQNKKTQHTIPTSFFKVLERLPYYRRHDMEMSIPLYKSDYAFPLIILQQVPRNQYTDPDNQRFLVLDNDGDMRVISLRFGQTEQAKVKLNELMKQGKTGYLVCLQKAKGLVVDIMEVDRVQKQALETVVLYFEETGREKYPYAAEIKEVLQRIKNTTLS